MEDSAGHTAPSKVWLLSLIALLFITGLVIVQKFQAAGGESTAAATYAHGVLDLTLPYYAAHAGAGQLTVEILDPEAAREALVILNAIWDKIGFLHPTLILELLALTSFGISWLTKGEFWMKDKVPAI